MARLSVDEILADTELLAILGAINVEWDEIEIALWRMFWKLMGGPWNRSYSIIYSQQNHRARREMVESLAAAIHRNDSPEFKKIARLLGRIKRAASKRNDISHGVWEHETGKTEIRRTPLKRDYNRGAALAYSKADLKRLRDQLTKLREDLDAYLD